MCVPMYNYLVAKETITKKKKKKGKLEAYFCPEILILKCQAKSSS